MATSISRFAILYHNEICNIFEHIHNLNAQQRYYINYIYRDNSRKENTGKTKNSFTIIVFDEVFIPCLYVVCVESVSSLHVVSIILRDSSRGYGLYQIMSKLEAHLTASEINKYLVEMTQHGLICPAGRGFNYEMTPNGVHFLKIYNELLKDTPDGSSGNCSYLPSLLFFFSKFVSKFKNRFFHGSDLP